jgi:branched-chain amino acid transport system substrate-binding protein
MKKNIFAFTILLFALLALILPLRQVDVADAQEEIILGVPTSLGSLEGKESHQAVILAVEEINSQGGVKLGDKMAPFKVEALDIRDSSPGVPVPEALLGLEKVILEKKANAIVVSPFRSEAILAGMDIVAKYKVPMLASIAASPVYTAKIGKDPKYKYCFRVATQAKFIVGGIVGGLFSLKQKFGFDKIYILNQDVAWARATAEIVGKVAGGKGFKVAGSERFPTGTTQFSSALMKVKASGAQIIVSVFDMPECGILVKQVNTMKIPAVITGFTQPMTQPSAWKTFEGNIAGVINQMLELANMPVKKWPKTLEFHEAYQKRWRAPVEAGHGPAPAYESVYMLKTAIEKAGSLDPDAIVSELEKIDYVGLLGRTRFDKEHQIVYGTDPNETALLGNYQWSKTGQRIIVYPEVVAEGDIWLPDHMK